MSLRRRAFLQLSTGATAALVAPRFAAAEAYPSRPVHIIVGFPPGSGPDIISRLVGQRLSERLGQQFAVENRPGAGSNIATEAVVRSPADGYTLLFAAASNAINATLYSNLTFDFVRDIAPVASVVSTPFVLVANPGLPAKTMAEFIAYSKANPGKVNMASPGNGTTPHLCGELLKMMTGINLVHVPYRSSYMTDLIGGQVQIVFSTATQIIDNVAAGKLRALGVTSAKRIDALPEVPAIAEAVPGYEAIGWFGVAAPKSTPTDTVSKLNAEINTIVADPDMTKRLLDLGVPPMSMTPGAFAAFITVETEKWAKVIRFAGIKPA
jgi:tripartite-type tricarboxylate transporter receptor subunit TctC